MGVPVINGWTVNSSAEANVLTLTKPASVGVGDLLLLIVGNDNGGAPSLQAVVGWTQALNIGSAMSATNYALYWRIADGTEDATVAVTSSYTGDMAGWYLRVTGAAADIPVVVGTPAEINADYSLAAPALRTLETDCLALAAGFFDGGDTSIPTISGEGWTRQDYRMTGGASHNLYAAWASKEMATAGSTGEVVFTATVQDGWTVCQWVVRGADSIMLPLVSSTYEDHDWSEWHRHTDAPGNLAVSADAALAGSDYGLALTPNGTNQYYAEQDVAWPAISDVVRARFHIDPNTIATSGNISCRVFALQGSNQYQYAAYVYFGKDGNGYYVGTALHDDGGTLVPRNKVYITDAPHWIELRLERASSAVASDGGLWLWVDGVAADSIAGAIDNYDSAAAIQTLRFGLVTCVDGFIGTFYLDELLTVGEDDPIGPADYSSDADVTGSGALTAQPVTIVASGVLRVSGSGGVTTQPATVAATGTQKITGTGAVAAQPASLAASGTQRVSGSAAVSAQPARLTGLGTLSVRGAGAVAAQPPTLTANGTQTVRGIAALYAQAVRLAGSGVVEIIPITELIALTLLARDRALTLEGRSSALRLRSRSRALTLREER